jgi:hypothetical protein
VIHEFEEIVRVIPWINKHASEDKYKKDTWISRKESYPSTELIALMIGEEIIIISIILLISIIFNNALIIIAFSFLNIVHLLCHLILGLIVKAWNPGTITSLLTIPLNLIVLFLSLPNNVNFIQLTLVTIIIAVILLGNLKILHRVAIVKSNSFSS